MSSQAIGERVSQGNLALLERWCGPQHHYTDVASPTDPDAELSIKSASQPYDSCEVTELSTVNVNHLTLLHDGLYESEVARAARVAGRNDQASARLVEAASKARVVAINRSPRNSQNIKDGANGPPFFLALTRGDVEIVSTLTTEPDSLGLLAEYNRVLALFKVREEEHPLLSDGQQFRSKFSGAFRNEPDWLDVIYQYSSVQELVEAKEIGEHSEDFIVVDQREGSLVYEDAFGNLIVRQADKRPFRSLSVGSFATYQITSGGKQYEVPVQVAENLKSAPAGKLVVYQNCDSGDDPYAAGILLETVVRVEDDNPRMSRETAGYFLRNLLGGEIAKDATIVLNAS
jgi:hypothetical protein